MKLNYLLTYFCLGFGALLSSMCIKSSVPIISLANKKYILDSINTQKELEIHKYATQIKTNLQIIQNKETSLSKISMSNDSIINTVIPDSIVNLTYNGK